VRQHEEASCKNECKMNMKIKLIIYLIISILLLACSKADDKKTSSVFNFNSGYSLHQDTLYVDIKGDMTHALKYKDKFYVLFEQRVLKYGGYGNRWLFIFSNGQLERIIDCPKEMRTGYLDFYTKNDSLILKPYMDKQAYYLEFKNYSWSKINKTDDLIFEDEEFKVYSLNFGEWGGKTWFKDKKTNQEYYIEATTPLVNKIGTTYYLTSPFKVIKIENPLLLNKCNDETYENSVLTGESYSGYGKPIGFVFVYQDTTFRYLDFNYRSHIVSSFVLNNELLHIYETDTATYIARHEGYSINPIQKISGNISFYNWHYSYRCPNLKGNNKLLKFRTNNKETFGLLDIIGHEIHITYFNNKALLEPILIGTEKADSIFVNRLNSILPEFHNLNLNVSDSLEQTWGSFDITPNHQVSMIPRWNPNNFTIDTCRSFLIKEDSIISNSVMYWATKKTGLVQVVTIEWDYEKDFMKPNSEELEKKSYDRKVDFLVDYLTQKLGKQIKRNDEKNYFEIEWKTSYGLMLVFTSNTKYYSNTLHIYKN
jgi:hypothetical protein